MSLDRIVAARPGLLTIGLFAAIAVTASGRAPAAERPFPRFRHVEIDPACGKVCYAVALADVDGDERPDIVAVTENRVLWYQNPGWRKRVIIEDQTDRDNVCIAAFDIDRDGRVDFALGAGWTGIGTIQWLSRGASLDDPWQVHAIGRERWTHRMRFADVLGTGAPQLVVSPLNRTEGNGVRLTAFEIPGRPTSERWPSTVLDQSLDRMHNHWHVDLDRDGQTDTLTASREGVHWIRRAGEDWAKTRLSDGYAGDRPESSGAGEIKLGQLAGGRRYLATVEPMHGHQAVVHLESTGGAGSPDGTSWERIVLDDSLARGHAVWTADLDGDESDELIVGHSDAGPGSVPGPALYVFDADDQNPPRWTKHLIDNAGVAVEDAVAGDVNGDGHIDIVAGGRATSNVKLYVNEGPSRGDGR